ncbi:MULTISPECIES: TauD/TfdA dioxygenase family protein [Gordonia]|jgi:taurine dioxygenase|uniref:TauD/TfdA family dioxygenase n=1 Tax=Gordonia tangerina TaxID=2911060 RepID=A0ABS9DN06_9ACTN|nr:MULTISPECIES: TauD/TfdA family dioxygenase [Gordonia]MAU81989.1 taurine catabolism dioxygenase [Gordonia sp. (in: high G+C Gram-positive bacteria)]MCF3940602.1 TauD/TfdA family dioxygenase [Gordonia tangerina]
MTLAQIDDRTERERAAQQVYADGGITVEKLGEHIGARIGQVRLGGDLPTEQVEAIRLALAVNKTVVFEGQHHLDDAGQYAFAGLLGEQTAPHPTVTSRGTQLLTIEGAANSWHSDVTFVDRIPKASILRAVTLPSYGGATTWASTVAAYEQLPKPLRALAEELWATHTNLYDYVNQSEPSGGVDISRKSEHYKEFTSAEYQTLHPVVRVHPETGERSLLLGHFAKEFRGLKSAEFGELYQLLQSRITKLENTFRWNWRLGDVVIWDNRATQHYGISDYGNQQRELHRITLAGDVPVDVRGQRSQVLQGDASHYSSVEKSARLPLFAA